MATTSLTTIDPKMSDLIPKEPTIVLLSSSTDGEPWVLSAYRTYANRPCLEFSFPNAPGRLFHQACADSYQELLTGIRLLSIGIHNFETQPTSGSILERADPNEASGMLLGILRADARTIRLSGGGNVVLSKMTSDVLTHEDVPFRVIVLRPGEFETVQVLDEQNIELASILREGTGQL